LSILARVPTFSSSPWHGVTRPQRRSGDHMPNIVSVTPTKNGSRNLGPSLCPGLLFPVPLHQPGALPPAWQRSSPVSLPGKPSPLATWKLGSHPKCSSTVTPRFVFTRKLKGLPLGLSLHATLTSFFGPLHRDLRC
jgi:hypothetical protein